MAATLASDSLYVRRVPSRYARKRLICFPYGGAGASVYLPWAEVLPPEIELAVIQLPGKEDRIFEQPFDRIGPLVRTVAQAIGPYLNFPFALFGHCSGALIAFELARELERTPGRGPRHLFVSGLPAPDLPARSRAIHALPDDEFKRELQLRRGTSDEILHNAELMDLLLPALRADFALCAHYKYMEREPLKCPLTVFGGVDDPGGLMHELDAWKALSKGRFSVRLFDGGHFFLNERTRDVAAAVVAGMERSFAGSSVEEL